jgi:RNA polymerase sigma-54 factor
MAKLNTELLAKQKLAQKLSPQMVITSSLLQKPLLEFELALQQEIRSNPFLEDLSNPSEEEIPEPEPTFDEESDDYDLTQEIQEINRIINDINESRNTQFEIEHKDDSLPKEGVVPYERAEESAWEIFYNEVRDLPLNPKEEHFAEAIVNNVNADGYLEISLEKLNTFGLSPQDAEKVHSMVMNIYPKGIGARDLAECLLAQLDEELQKDEILVSIIKNDLYLLEQHKFKQLLQKYNIGSTTLLYFKEIISNLDPKPGRRISSKITHYVVPDIVVKEIDDDFEILVNDSHLPDVGINREFARRMLDKSAQNKTALKYVKAKIALAENYVKAVWMRRETLYNIAQELVKRQSKFFRSGIKELVPMTYENIAKKAKRDVSTVSRVVQNKYIDTPFGVYPLKWFFTNKIGQRSSRYIKREIADIITMEDKSHPLSDRKIQDELAQKGMEISLRTVTKYRNELGIPVSRLRKQ